MCSGVQLQATHNSPMKTSHEKLSLIFCNISVSDSWKLYLKNIEDANKNYKGCPNEKIGCFRQQIDDDLSFWEKKGGIKKETFENAIQRQVGEHYQIINHKLYRKQKDCMFPFR